MHGVISMAPIPEVIRSKPNLYCSCIDGAVSIDDYKHMMMKAGLTNIKAVDYSKHTKMALDKEIFSKGLDTLKGDKAFGEIVDFARRIASATLSSLEQNRRNRSFEEIYTVPFRLP